MDYIYSRLSNITSVNELEKEILDLKTVKQDQLVSGKTIKTINDQSVLGAGNISIVEGKLANSLAAAIDVGGVSAGTIFPAGTDIETILREIFQTNISYTLYWGVCRNEPVQVNGEFEAADIPIDFAQHGIEHRFTTKRPGEEIGNFCAFAYPATYGPLAHIYCNDLVLFDLLDNWECLTITVGGTSFYLYYQKVRTKDEDTKYSFIF